MKVSKKQLIIASILSGGLLAPSSMIYWFFFNDLDTKPVAAPQASQAQTLAGATSGAAHSYADAKELYEEESDQNEHDHVEALQSISLVCLLICTFTAICVATTLGAEPLLDLFQEGLKELQLNDALPHDHWGVSVLQYYSLAAVSSVAVTPVSGLLTKAIRGAA